MGTNGADLFVRRLDMQCNVSFVRCIPLSNKVRYHKENIRAILNMADIAKTSTNRFNRK